MANVSISEKCDENRALDDGVPTPHELDGFVRVAETLHFGRAARAMGLAQSSLSECVRRLEAKLGVVLFERTSRRVVLTQAGAALLPDARGVLQRLEAARASVMNLGEPSRPTLRVGMEGWGFDALFDHHLIERFQEAFPGLDVVIFEMHGTPEGFKASAADVAYVHSPMADPELVVHPLHHEPRGIVVPSQHPMASADRVSIDDLLDETFVQVAPQDPTTRDYWLGAELRGRRPPRVAGAANSCMEVIYAVAHLGWLTTGIAPVIHPRSGKPNLPGVRLVEVDELSPVREGIAVRAGERRRPVLAFVELAAEAAGATAMATGIGAPPETLEAELADVVAGVPDPPPAAIQSSNTWSYVA